jgi:hypothetical protein
MAFTSTETIGGEAAALWGGLLTHPAQPVPRGAPGNPKREIRKPQQPGEIRGPQADTSALSGRFGHFRIRIFTLFRISNFAFRV